MAVLSSSNRALALSFLLLVGKLSAQQLTQKCVDEFGELSNNSTVSAVNTERGDLFDSKTSECAQGVETCAVDLSPIAQSYGDACEAAGGQTLTFSYSISCPNRDDLLIQSYPLCTGASCNGDDFISAFVSIRENQLEADGVTGCVVERVEDQDVTSPSGGSPLLSQQCLDDIQAIALTEGIVQAKNLTDDLYDTQTANCTNATVCTTDYSSAQSKYKRACEKEGGQFVAFDYSVTCPDQGLEFLSFPDCIGTSCDLDKYYTMFESTTEAALVEGGFTGCVIEIKKAETAPPTPAPITIVKTRPPVAAPTEAPNCDEVVEALYKDNNLDPVSPPLNHDNCSGGLCSIDYSEDNSEYERQCGAAGGQYGELDTVVSCTSDDGTLTIEVINFPYCAAEGCDTDSLEDTLINQFPASFDARVEQDIGIPVDCAIVEAGTVPDGSSGASSTIVCLSTVIAIMSAITMSMW